MPSQEHSDHGTGSTVGEYVTTPRSASDGSHGTNPGSLPTRIPATASSRRQNLDNTTSPHTPLARPPTDSTSRITAEQRVLLRIYSYFLLFACIHSMNMTPEHMQSLCDDATDSSLLHPCSNTSAIYPYESALSQTRLYNSSTLFVRYPLNHVPDLTLPRSLDR